MAKGFDLETDMTLLEQLKAGGRGDEAELVDISRHAADIGAHEIADRLDQFIRERLSRPQAIYAVWTSRWWRRP